MAQGRLGGEEVVAGGGIDAAREGFPEGVGTEIRGLDAGPEEVPLHDPVDLAGSQWEPLLSAGEEGRARIAGTPLRQKAAQQSPDAFDQGDGAAAHGAAVHAPAPLEAGSLHGDVAGDAAAPQADLAHGKGGELGGAEASTQAEKEEHLVAQGGLGEVGEEAGFVCEGKGRACGHGLTICSPSRPLPAGEPPARR